MPSHLIDTDESVAAAVAALAGAPLLFVDTEFDSSREGTRLSLIQVSRGDEVFLIDALRIRDLSPLSVTFGAGRCTWVLHAGQQDVALLMARLGLDEPPPIFDTQIAWGMLTVEHSASLAYLKYRLLGMRVEKPHQADDWIRRPLPPAQLAYAAEDVEHLPAIYSELRARCDASGRYTAVLDASRETLAGVPDIPVPLALSAFRNAWQLEREGQAVLQFLIEWYNALSPTERAAAPDQKGMMALASRRPRSLEDLSGLRAIPRRTVQQHGRTLLAGIQRALAAADSAEFITIEPSPYATSAELLSHGWLEAIRAEVCVALGIAPELGFPARLVRRMREAAMSSGRLESAAELLQGWRHTLLADEFVQRAKRYGDLPAPGR